MLYCFRRALPAFALSVAASLPAVAQQLVVNSEFDRDLSGWSIPDPASATWVAFDRANPASGSVLLFNAATAANTGIVLLRQCFVPSLRGRYELSARGFLPVNQGPGFVVVSYDLKPGLACAGDASHNGSAVFLEAFGAWLSGQLQTGEIDPAEAPQSILVQVGLFKAQAGGSFQAAADSIRFTLVPLHADGFESAPPP